MIIGFIGTGNMGGAIIKGYAPSAESRGDELLLYNRTAAKAEEIAAGFKSCRLAAGIDEVTRLSDIIFGCVEPANFAEIMPEIAKHYRADKVFVSIAAGITIDALESYLGSDAKIIRSMPNTPIMHGLGATAMVRNKNTNDDDFDAVRRVFTSGGIAGEISEDLIPAVIGVSGSSPAYTYMYIDALIKAGVDAGLSPEMSREFASQAVMGAAAMVQRSGESPSALCDKVCTPGGTTIEAVRKLGETDFENIVKSGAKAAIDRAKEMSE